LHDVGDLVEPLRAERATHPLREERGLGEHRLQTIIDPNGVARAVVVGLVARGRHVACPWRFGVDDAHVVGPVGGLRALERPGGEQPLEELARGGRRHVPQRRQLARGSGRDAVPRRAPVQLQRRAKPGRQLPRHPGQLLHAGQQQRQGPCPVEQLRQLDRRSLAGVGPSLALSHPAGQEAGRDEASGMAAFG